MSLGFVKSLSEYTLYVKKVDEDMLVISLYVDDLFVIGSCKEIIDKFKEEMESVFEMTDLRKMAFFSWYASVAKAKWNICVLRNICKGSSYEVQHGRVQINYNSNESKRKVL